MIFPLLKLTVRKAMVKVLLDCYTCTQGVMDQIPTTLICTENHLRLFGGGWGLVWGLLAIRVFQGLDLQKTNINENTKL